MVAEKIIIIGAGQAGAQAAASLRQAGFDGSITMVGEENSPPYQRPPLSKAYLQGALEEARLYLRPTEFYERNNIDLRLGARAKAIDRSAKRIALDGGEELEYDKLLIATGAPPRRLRAPGAGLDGVIYLRTLADCDGLRPDLRSGARAVIVGAGYIGLEVAASARKAGMEVTVLEMCDRVLSRVTGETVSSFYQRTHRAAGVDLRLGATLHGFDGSGKIEAARLSSGEVIRCDVALVGIGAVPAVDLAKEAGLKVDNGLWVDEYARTEDPSIWAAGDCTNHPSVLYGRRMRLESVPNAIEQAKAAAANMAGKVVIYDAVPWFWSDQYDVKLQTAGICAGFDATVIRGDRSAKQFSVWYLSEERLLAVDAINDPASFAAGRKLIGQKASPDIKVLADPAGDLKSLIS